MTRVPTSSSPGQPLALIAVMTIVLVVLQANPANAQEPKAGSDWHNVQALPIGTKVEVNARSQHLRCSLVAVTEDGLSCSHGAEKTSTTLQRVDVRSVKIVRRDRSVLIGAGLG